MEISEKILSELNPYEQKWLELVQEAKAIEIITAEDVVKANAILKKCNAVAKEAETKRLEMTQPVNKRVKSLIATVKTLLKPTEEAKHTIKKKIVEYNNELEKKRKAEEERLRKEQEEEQKRIDEENRKKQEEIDKIDNKVEQEFARKKAEAKAEEERKAREAEEKAKADAIAANAQASKPKWMRTVRLFEVTQSDAVPRAFCTPDDAIIREAVKNWVREIDWVRIYSENRVQ